LTGRKFGEAIGPDRHAYQTQRRIADRRSHASHLPIASFCDDELKPGGGDISSKTDRRIARPKVRLGNSACLRRAGSRAIEHDTGLQFIERFHGGLSLDLHPIGLRQLVARVAQQMLQCPVIREYQQPLAVPVEAARRIYARYPDVSGKGRASFLVRELSQYPIGLVEEQKHSEQLGVPMRVRWGAATEDAERLPAGVGNAVCGPRRNANGIAGVHIEFLGAKAHAPVPGGNVVELLAHVVPMQSRRLARRDSGLGQA